MPDVVTFDPDNLWITEINTGQGVNSTDLVEIYSEWKAWLVADSSRLGYPAAFRQAGADPISDIQNTGATFFLGGGWKLKPAEYDHQWEIVGNLFTDPAGLRRTTPTDGAYTVEVTFFVSNLVDSSVARLDLNQLLQGVYIDPALGVAGTSDDVGTPTNPVNNIADAVTIATTRNLSTFYLHGALTLDRNFSNWSFIGLGNHLSNSIDIAGYGVNGCLFERMTLSGSMSGRIEARNCGVSLITGLDGVFERCGFLNDFSIAAGGAFIGFDCYSEISDPSVDIVNVTVGATSSFQLRNYSGGIELENFVAGNIGSIDLDPGALVINANCTGGALIVRGLGSIERNDGDAVTIDTTSFVSDPSGKLRRTLVLGKTEAAPELLIEQEPP